VLRPGGQLMILEFFRPTSWWPRLFYGTFGRTVMPLVGGMLSGDRSAYSYLNASIQGFLSTAEAAAIIGACGGGNLRWARCFGGVSHAVAADKVG
jgi:demethylmenaquinone methyltransferase/2-methoxy-6-polyprenyl-1,4-benzoquinol methylase